MTRKFIITFSSLFCVAVLTSGASLFQQESNPIVIQATKIDNDTTFYNGSVSSPITLVKSYPEEYTIKSLNLSVTTDPEGSGSANVTDGGEGFSFWEVTFSITNDSVLFEMYVVTEHEVSKI